MKQIHHRVKHHHVFIFIFLGISVLFAGNILAINQVYNLVKKSEPNELDTQIILARYDDSSELNTENNLNPLAEELTEKLLEYDVPIAIGVKDLSNNEAIGLNDKVTFQSGSFYKLFVGYELLRQIDLEILKLNDEIQLENGNISLQDCFELMIKASDNECGRELRKLVGADTKPLGSLASFGFVGTNLMNDYPVTSVSDVVLLFDKLYGQDDLQPKSNQLFVNALTQQEINNRLPLGLPETAKIAHKTADLEGFSHDGGIIYTTFGDYIVVIMSGPWENEYVDAPPVFVELMKMIYEELSSLANS